MAVRWPWRMPSLRCPRLQSAWDREGRQILGVWRMSVMKGLLMLLVPFVLGFTGCGRAPVAPVPSTAPWSAPADEPRAIVEAYLQAYSRGDIDASLRLLADDVVQEQDPPGVKVQGKADVELNLRAFSVMVCSFTLPAAISILKGLKSGSSTS